MKPAGNLQNRLRLAASLGGIVVAISCSKPTEPASPAELEAQTRVAETRLAMEAFATALETARLDSGIYPVSTTDHAETADADLMKANPALDWSTPAVRAVRTPPPIDRSANKMNRDVTWMSLTSPIAYLTSIPPDPFATPQGRGLAYHSVSSVSPGRFAGGTDGWIIWSAGPDGDYDLDWKSYQPAADSPTRGLSVNTLYDPTNGWMSDGDLCRMILLP